MAEPMSRNAAIEYTIEIAGPQNEQVQFRCTKQILRGRWTHVVAGGRSVHESLSALHAAAPTIPGMYVAVSPDARTSRCYDPLKETPDGRRIWAAMLPVLRQYQHNFGQMKPAEQVASSGLSADEVKEWLFAMRNLVDSGMAEMAPGSPPLPSMDAIKAMPGRICLNYSGVLNEEQTRYIHSVPVDSPALAGTGK